MNHKSYCDYRLINAIYVYIVVWFDSFRTGLIMSAPPFWLTFEFGHKQKKLPTPVTYHNQTIISTTFIYSLQLLTLLTVRHSKHTFNKSMWRIHRFIFVQKPHKTRKYRVTREQYRNWKQNTGTLLCLVYFSGRTVFTRLAEDLILCFENETSVSFLCSLDNIYNSLN